MRSARGPARVQAVVCLRRGRGPSNNFSYKAVWPARFIHPYIDSTNLIECMARYLSVHMCTKQPDSELTDQLPGVVRQGLVQPPRRRIDTHSTL